MANELWPSAREGFLSGAIDWDTATIKASLLRGYTYNSAHVFVSELIGAGGSLVSTVTLTSKTVVGGAADAADVVFPSVTAGAAIPAAVIYQTSAPTGGSDLATSAQRLIMFCDTGTNLPITPNGQNVTWIFDAGVNRIFRI